MDSKKVLEKLLKIAENQQKVIQKLAQQQMGAMPQNIAPQEATKRDATAILAALPPAVKSAVANLEVHGSDVMVRFQPGKGTDQVFNAILSTVQNLQNSNTLTSKNYQVKEVA